MSRLSEEQFPSVETQHPLRRMARIFGARIFVRQIVGGEDHEEKDQFEAVR